MGTNTLVVTVNAQAIEFKMMTQRTLDTLDAVVLKRKLLNLTKHTKIKKEMKHEAQSKRVTGSLVKIHVAKLFQTQIQDNILFIRNWIRYTKKNIRIRNK